MLRIDLGCGYNKQTGFIGVDRYALPGVDVIADINKILPFSDDSFDLLFASHSLEHVENLLETLKELYRISKHGTQWCVVAPYSEQRLNQANPYHTCVFNEHTTRFWTDYASTLIDPDEYYHPQCPQWGLSTSDNSNPGIDIRTVRMECFYFPRYAGLPPSEQRRMRQERAEVCEQIMYHLIVWKGDGEVGGRSFDDYVAEFQPYEPQYITQLRDRGREMLFENNVAAAVDAKAEQLQSGLVEGLRADPEREKSLLTPEVKHPERLRGDLRVAKDDLNQLRTHSVSLSGEIIQLHELCAAQTEALTRLTTDLHDTAAYNRILRDDTVRIERELDFARAERRRLSATAAAAQDEVSVLVRQNQDLKAKLESNDLLRAKLGLTRAELETTAALLDLYRQKEEGLSAELTVAREGAAVATQEAERWRTLFSAAKKSLSAIAVEPRNPQFAHLARVGDFIIGRDRRIQELPNGFLPLREYCDRHFHTARACLGLGGDLVDMPFWDYVIPLELNRLTAVSVAIRSLDPESSGMLGIEIVSARSEVLVQVRMELKIIPRDGVAEFRLPDPLTGLEKGWLLRVFVRDAILPVSVYELVRRGIFRASIRSFPLVLFR